MEHTSLKFCGEPGIVSDWVLPHSVPRLISFVAGRLSEADLQCLFANPTYGSYPVAGPGGKVSIAFGVSDKDIFEPDFSNANKFLKPVQSVIEGIWCAEKNRLKQVEQPKYATIFMELVTAGANKYYRDTWHQEGCDKDNFINYSFATYRPTEMRGASTSAGEIWCRDGNVEHRAPGLTKPSPEDRLIFWTDFSY